MKEMPAPASLIAETARTDAPFEYWGCAVLS